MKCVKKACCLLLITLLFTIGYCPSQGMEDKSPSTDTDAYIVYASLMSKFGNVQKIVSLANEYYGSVGADDYVRPETISPKGKLLKPGQWAWNRYQVFVYGEPWDVPENFTYDGLWNKKTGKLDGSTSEKVTKERLLSGNYIPRYLGYTEQASAAVPNSTFPHEVKSDGVPEKDKNWVYRSWDNRYVEEHINSNKDIFKHIRKNGYSINKFSKNLVCHKRRKWRTRI